MELEIEIRNHQDMMNALASGFGTKTRATGTETGIRFPTKAGQGEVKSIDFFDGLGMIHFQGNLKNTVLLKYHPDDKHPIRFMFSEKGQVVHVLDPGTLRYKMSSLVGSISGSTVSHSQWIMLPPESDFSFFMLEIRNDLFYSKIKKDIKAIPEKLADLFKNSIDQPYFLYQGNYNLNVAECLNQIKTNPHQGMVRRIFLESKALDLLWMQIKQYKDDQHPENIGNLLKKRDIGLIMEAKKILLADLKNPPDMKSLAELTGTNTSKLKWGFKKLFDKTVGEVLRDERMNHAKILLAEENMNIKEIAEAVGYSNKSAFSKRFRERFGVLPRDFMKRYNQS